MTQATLGNAAHPEYGVATIPFPIPREEYANFVALLEALEIGDASDRDCQVQEVRGPWPVLKRLEGKPVNLDELDYLAKRLDSFSSGELAQFQALAEMSVNAGKHYDDAAQCYRLLNNTGGQLLFYVLAYKGNEANPNGSQNRVVLETADSDAVFAGFQNRVSVTVGTARTAGRYTDTLTFRFTLV